MIKKNIKILFFYKLKIFTDFINFFKQVLLNEEITKNKNLSEYFLLYLKNVTFIATFSVV